MSEHDLEEFFFSVHNLLINSTRLRASGDFSLEYLILKLEDASQVLLGISLAISNVSGFENVKNDLNSYIDGLTLTLHNLYQRILKQKQIHPTYHHKLVLLVVAPDT